MSLRFELYRVEVVMVPARGLSQHPSPCCPFYAGRGTEGGRVRVYQEVQGLATQGSVRRIDIIAIKNNSAYILDPTIRFETHADQLHEVDTEKKRIYEPTIPFYEDKYSLSHIDVIGLMVGARGTIPYFFANECPVQQVEIICMRGNESREKLQLFIIIYQAGLHVNMPALFTAETRSSLITVEATCSARIMSRYSISYSKVAY
ncbi:hypothetical protein ANN_07712 [Periplaneta americana]|uniref:Uncharacterized protein n=1 Tax=Periplaneta americana TaxID=6978 RepID=A0ABQ8SZE0_PERAM|nr:hypothetical protein ANN_07712 [Periplaneta americana]